MGMFEDMCMVTGLPILNEPIAVFLLRRDVSTAPWQLLGGPILGQRDAYGGLDEVRFGKSEEWLTPRLIEAFGKVEPDDKVVEPWSTQETGAAGLTAFAQFAMALTRAVEFEPDLGYPRYSSGEFACAEILSSVLDAILEDAPIAELPNQLPELVPPPRISEVSRLLAWLAGNRVQWKAITPEQTSEDQQVQAFLQARARWSGSRPISTAIEGYLQRYEWAWERGFL